MHATTNSPLLPDTICILLLPRSHAPWLGALSSTTKLVIKDYRLSHIFVQPDPSSPSGKHRIVGSLPLMPEGLQTLKITLLVKCSTKSRLFCPHHLQSQNAQLNLPIYFLNYSINQTHILIHKSWAPLDVNQPLFAGEKRKFRRQSMEFHSKHNFSLSK